MRVLAVDLGATSVRVAAVDLDRDIPRPEVVHRWRHGPVTHDDGTLRWDWPGIVREVRHGIDLALADGPVASIGVDGWGVDYGLLDDAGALVAPPYSYRDGRTAAWGSVADRIGRDHLYERTGIQLMPINTVFQLALHDPTELARATQLLLLPDLLVHELTGWVGTERSNASTTALLDPGTGDWADDVIAAAGLPAQLLAPIHTAGSRVGTYRGVPVHLVGSHDTASAFAGAPAVPGPGTVLVSSGTWVLVGVERPSPDTSDDARAANFSNELGALGGVRFLRNVAGLWMLERCRSSWGDPPIDALLREAERVGPGPTVDTRDERFLAPPDMDQEIRRAAGLDPTAPRAAVTRCILDSVAAGAADVIAALPRLTGAPVDELFVIGGGVQLDLLNQLYGDHAGVPVRTGSAEATALGNARVQGVALGRWADLDEARAAAAGEGGP